MRIFHELIFDGWVNGNATALAFTEPAFSRKMGRVDMIHLSGYASCVSGTSPALQILASSTPEIFDFSVTSNFVLLGKALSTTGETLFQTLDVSAASAVKYCYNRMQLGLTGTNPRAFIRLWATGRDWSRRSHDVAMGKGCDNGGSCGDKTAGMAPAATGPSY